MQSILALHVLFCVLISVQGVGPLIGVGKWWVQNIDQCPDSDQYRLTFDLSRKKMNRTHDSFTVTLEHDKEFNDLYGIEVEVYKLVDGGFKYYQFLEDKSACHFAKKYAAESLHELFVLAGIDPPDCPVAPGNYTAKDFVFNYSELTDPFVYGTYEIDCYLIYDGERVTCIKLFAKFEPNSNSDDQDDDNDDDE